MKAVGAFSAEEDELGGRKLGFPTTRRPCQYRQELPTDQVLDKKYKTIDRY